MTDLRRVATLAGVSRDTAARAFSAPPLLNPDTLHKGLAASVQPGLRPHHIARQLRLSTPASWEVAAFAASSGFVRQLQAIEPLANVSHQVVLELQPDDPAHFVLEPPRFLLQRWQPGQRMVPHQYAIDRFSGLWPFYNQQELID